LKVLLTNKFRLSKSISVNILATHLTNFFNDYDILFSEKRKNSRNFSFKDEFLAYESSKIPFTEEELIDFAKYCQRIKNLIVGIKNILDCEFQNQFKKLYRVDFSRIFEFLIKRWKLSL